MRKDSCKLLHFRCPCLLVWLSTRLSRRCRPVAIRQRVALLAESTLRNNKPWLVLR